MTANSGLTVYKYGLYCLQLTGHGEPGRNGKTALSLVGSEARPDAENVTTRPLAVGVPRAQGRLPRRGRVI